jgi:H+/Cl- antiporter ClcA
MKKYILASLCSAFIVPGLGQIINQNLKKGIFILSVVFFLFIVGTIKLFFILQSAIANANLGRLNTASIEEGLQDKDFTVLWLLLGLFAMVWVYSILDAFWVGKRMERQ